MNNKLFDLYQADEVDKDIEEAILTLAVVAKHETRQRQAEFLNALRDGTKMRFLDRFLKLWGAVWNDTSGMDMVFHWISSDTMPIEYFQPDDPDLFHKVLTKHLIKGFLINSNNINVFRKSFVSMAEVLLVHALRQEEHAWFSVVAALRILIHIEDIRALEVVGKFREVLLENISQLNDAMDYIYMCPSKDLMTLVSVGGFFDEEDFDRWFVENVTSYEQLKVLVKERPIGNILHDYFRLDLIRSPNQMEEIALLLRERDGDFENVRQVLTQNKHLLTPILSEGLRI